MTRQAKARYLRIRVGGSIIIATIFLLTGILIGRGSSAKEMSKNNQIWQDRVKSVRIEEEQARTALKVNIDTLNSRINDLETEKHMLQKQLDYYTAGYLQDHSDWLDSQSALSFIEGQLTEIDRIDNQAPIPVIYLKDGSKVVADANHDYIRVFSD